MKNLQKEKSNQLNKHELYSQFADLKSEMVDKNFKIEFLEKVVKEKDDRLKELEMQVFNQK